MQSFLARHIRIALPALCLAVLLAAVFVMQPRAMSYVGLNLLLNLALPIAFATVAQMFVIAVGELDLGIGAYVGFVACVGATWLNTDPAVGVLMLAGGVLVYAAVGALIFWRGLPSIVVTLGMSFVWLGLAILVLPTPGGKAPDWLQAAMKVKTPLLPMTIFASVALALVVHWGLMRSSYGAVLRGAGGNPRSIERAGWSLIKIHVVMFGLAGLFGLLAGLSLVGLTTSGDANIALRYTLLSIAGVILGGGEFTGGRVSPVGAVIGAMTLTLAASFLSFLRLDPDWQIGAQGVILILVLALRVLINRTEARAA
ncbi:MAG TPA: ABC transporter permease [Mesorhizobium sp.]|jgi:ribose transport system permease protein|nr:ABC transporter permease [Mesorhizobium sp.]